MNSWDGKWRMVIFDIPERIRSGRNALRTKLKQIGFYELQKSVFIFPHECEKEIKIIVNFFRMDKYVKYVVAEYIDNNNQIKKIFNLDRKLDRK
jgi:CRISPR-associated endonuclease Cas2